MITETLIFAAYVSSSYIAQIHSIANEVPCEARLEIRKMHRHGGAGKGVIGIDPRSKGADLRYVVLHEMYHVCSLDNPEWILPLFGKSPFVTEYAKKNAMEDFAEEATNLHLNGATTRKGRVIRRFLNSLTSQN